MIDIALDVLLFALGFAAGSFGGFRAFLMQQRKIDAMEAGLKEAVRVISVLKADYESFLTEYQKGDGANEHQAESSCSNDEHP